MNWRSAVRSACATSWMRREHSSVSNNVCARTLSLCSSTFFHTKDFVAETLRASRERCASAEVGRPQSRSNRGRHASEGRGRRRRALLVVIVGRLMWTLSYTAWDDDRSMQVQMHAAQWGGTRRR